MRAMVELCRPVPPLFLPDVLLVIEETGRRGSVGLLAGAGSRPGRTCVFTKGASACFAA
jgi:hypothetical protein